MKLVILGVCGYGRTVEEIAWKWGKYARDSDEQFMTYTTDELASGKCVNHINYISSDTEIYSIFGNREGKI